MTQSQSTKVVTHLGLVILSLAALITGVTGASLANASELKVGGFVDAQYQTRPFAPALLNERNSFIINDGNFTFEKEQGNANFFLAIPFRGGFNGAATTSGTVIVPGTSNFTVGANTAQAYVGYKYNDKLSWKLGQFESLYGFESNETSDIAFTTQGLLKTNFTPSTHDGLAATFNMNKDAGVTAMIANHHDQGTVGGLRPDFGVKVFNSPNWYRASFGVLIEDKAATTNAEKAIYDLMLGKTMGVMSVDAELMIKSLGSSNGWAGLLNDSCAFTDKVNGVVRFEYENKMESVYKNQFELGVGPTYALSKELITKADFYLLSQNNYVTTGTQKNFAVSAVYKF